MTSGGTEPPTGFGRVPGLTSGGVSPAVRVRESEPDMTSGGGERPDVSHEPAGRRPSEAGRARLVVLLAVLVAALLRAPVTRAALPFVHHPDEPHNIVLAEQMVADRTVRPGDFIYPAVIYDVSAAFLAVTDHQ